MGPRNLLVTGGAGFIGANFVRYWRNRHPADRVIVLDVLTYAGNLANLAGLDNSPDYRFVHGDIRDQDLVESLLRQEKVDTIVHLAAESHVDRSILGPDAFIEANVIGTHNLLKAARSVWFDGVNGVDTHRFHHVSTDEVYGSLTPDAAAFSETTPYDPSSPYSASKAASDHLVKAYHRTYRLNVTISNCSNNYGPYQFPEKLIPLTVVNILQNKTIPIYGDGKNVRDWLYVSDHCRGIERVLEEGETGETYNIGGNNEWQNIEIVKAICREMDEAFSNDATLSERFPDSPAGENRGSGSLIRFIEDRPGHDRRYAINPDKIRSAFGFKPKESFETGIRKTIRWFLDNEDWWRDVMDGSYQHWIDKQYSAERGSV